MQQNSARNAGYSKGRKVPQSGKSVSPFNKVIETGSLAKKLSVDYDQSTIPNLYENDTQQSNQDSKIHAQ